MQDKRTAVKGKKNYKAPKTLAGADDVIRETGLRPKQQNKSRKRVKQLQKRANLQSVDTVWSMRKLTVGGGGREIYG
jgi:hypothetical protein